MLRIAGNVTTEARELEAQIAKAAQRWAALKPGPDSMRSWSQQEVKNVLDLLAEWSDTVESLRKNATSVQESCESFGAPRPGFEGLVALEVSGVMLCPCSAPTRAWSCRLSSSARVH